MDFTLAKTIAELTAVGAITFMLVYGVIKGIKFMDNFLNNHMTHIQKNTEATLKATHTTNTKLDKLIELFTKK